MTQLEVLSVIRAALGRALDNVDDASADSLVHTAQTGAETSPLVIRSFVEPEQFRSRVEDSCELGSSEVSRTVTLHYRLELEDQHKATICVVRPVKGRTLRGMEVRGASDERLRVLGETEKRVVLMRLLLGQLTAVARVLNLSAQTTAEWETALALLILSRPVLTDRKERDDLEALMAARVRSLLGAGEDRDGALGNFVAATAKATTRDPVFVEVEGHQGGRLTYTQLDRYGPRPGRGWRVRLARSRAEMSMVLGAVPNQVWLPTYKGGQSAEHLLEVCLQPGNFVLRVSPAVPGHPLRGIGTRRAELLQSRDRGLHAGTPTHLEVEIRQVPSGALLRSTSLALLVTGLAAALCWTASRFSQSLGGTTALEALSWATAVGSIAFIATWAVLVHSVEGMALDLPAIASSICSSVVLLSLVGVLALAPDDRQWLVVLAGVQFGNAMTITGALTTRLVQLRRSLIVDAAIDLEGPHA